MDNSSIDSALIDLQSRLAYQEDLLQSLNKTCYEQAQRLEQLELRNAELMEHLRGMIARDNDGAADDQPPPHY